MANAAFGISSTLRRRARSSGWLTLLGGGGLAILLAALAQNAGNLVFHALASQAIGPAAYGALGAVLALTVAFTIPLGALQVAITRGIAESGADSDPRAVLTRVFRVALGAGILVACISPLVQEFLHLGSLTLPLLLAPYTVLAAVAAASRGAAIGRERLRPAALSILAATAVRLIAGAIGLWLLGALGALLATLAAEAVGAAVALWAALVDSRGDEPATIGVDALVETSAVTAGIWMLGSVDVLLARHYLSAGSAGLYVAAGTATRAVLVLPQALLMIAMPRFVEAIRGGTNRSVVAWRALTRTATLALVLTGLGALLMGVLGPSVLRMAFGIDAPNASETVWLLAAGTLPTALATVHSTYKLAWHSRLALLPWLGAIAEMLAIMRWHSSTTAVALAALLGVGLQAVLLVGLIVDEDRRTRLDHARGPEASDPQPRTVGLRILVFSWRDLAHPDSGGSEVFVEEVARRWVGAGHDVTIFCAAVEGRPERETTHGVKIIRRGSRLGVYRAARRFWVSEGEGNFDLAIDTVNTRPFGAPQFVRETPVVALAHQVCRDVWFHEFNVAVASVGRFVLEPYWLRRYRDVPTMTISTSSKASLADYGLRSVHVVPIGVRPPEPVAGSQKRRHPTLVVCGRLVRSKRVDHAIEAFAIVRATIPECRLIVIGTGPEAGRLTSLAPEGVEFVGHVDNAEKFRIMAEAHALIATSVREGWGLIVSEAATVGTPTAAYDVPGLRDSVVAAGGRLSAPNPAALAGVLRDALPEWINNPPAPIPWGGATTWDAAAVEVLATALGVTGLQLPAPCADAPEHALRSVTPAGVGTT